jgi:hypothetical protein
MEGFTAYLRYNFSICLLRTEKNHENLSQNSQALPGISKYEEHYHLHSDFITNTATATTTTAAAAATTTTTTTEISHYKGVCMMDT